MSKPGRDPLESTPRFRQWLRSELTHALALVEQARPERNNPALDELSEIIIRVDVHLLPLISSTEEARLEEEERKRARRIAVREAGLDPALMRLDKAIGAAAAAFAETGHPVAHAIRIDSLVSRFLDLLSHANPAAFGYERSQNADRIDYDERLPRILAALREIFPEPGGASRRM